MRACILLVFFLPLSIYTQAQNQFKVAAVGFYNCDHFFDEVHDTAKNDEDYTPEGMYHYTAAVYEQKKHNMATAISRMGTDVTPDGPAILGLAEVENDVVLGDLVATNELRGRNYKYVWEKAADRNCYNVALLYNPKYLMVLGYKYIRVPVETLRQKKHVRSILYVTGLLAGDTVGLIVCHWPADMGNDAASEAVRELTAQMTKQIADSQFAINPHAKMILMGDLNDNPDGSFCRILKGKENRSDVAPDELYNPWPRMFKNGAGTEEYRGAWKLTSQVLVSGGLLKNKNHKWQYYGEEVYKKDWLLYGTGRDKGFPHKPFTSSHVWDNGYSIHLPVIVYLVEKK
jgi:hypothetical protein